MVRGEGRLAGAVVVVTGASRGIGKQVSLALAREGAQLVLAARTVDPRPGTPGTIGDTAAAVAELGPSPLVVPADLSRADDVDRLVTSTLDAFDHVDILINNAGYTVGRAIYTHVPNLTRDQWEKVMAINVTAPLMLIQGFWPSMVERGGGRIVNITSGAARPTSLDARLDLPATDEIGPAYPASKAALDRMANAIAADGAPHGIAVVNVAPGRVMTETLAATLEATGLVDEDAISADVPVSAVVELCTCADPMRYSGTVIDAEAFVSQFGGG